MNHRACPLKTRESSGVCVSFSKERFAEDFEEVLLNVGRLTWISTHGNHPSSKLNFVNEREEMDIVAKLLRGCS